jgi:5-carboxymethyl-2-hydroxymuconate isomerase
MPHVTLEYSKNLTNLDVKSVLLKLNQALLATGEFREIDIKTRALPVEQVQIGLSSDSHGFIHVEIKFYKGRSTELKRKIAQACFEVLRSNCKPLPRMTLQMDVEPIEIDQDVFVRETIDAA